MATASPPTVAKSPPGPPGRWLTGHLPDIRRDMLGFFTRLAREHGDVAAFRMGPRPAVLISHPDAIEEVLLTQNRNFTKHYVMQILRPVLGNGLLTSEGDFWLRQRKLIQPAFGKQRVEAYGAIMVEHTERQMAEWRDGQEVDLHHEMMRLALSIVAKALLDVDLTSQYTDVGRCLDFLMEDFSYRFENVFSIPMWFPTPWNRRAQRSIHRLFEIIEEIIRQRRAAGADRGDLLSILVQARDEADGSGMTDRQVRDEVMTLFLAGHETTANALSWTWYLLAGHPEVETKLRAELRDVLGDRPPAVADLPRLRYAEQVVTEAMRLYPPAYAFGRRAIDACTIAGYPFPAGQTFIMSQWVVHRDPRFWDRSDAFLPERWADEKTKQLPKYAYFPFGGGPRVCIGNNFAMIEATLILATIARKFRFALAPGQTIRPWPSITLRPAGGMRAVVQAGD